MWSNFNQISVNYGTKFAIMLAISVTVIVGAIQFSGILNSNQPEIGAYNTVQGVNIPDYFDINVMDLAGTASTAGTTAPAINCAITNSVHLIGIDGSDYSLNTQQGKFEPVADTLINPYNHSVLSNVKVVVYLYCDSSSLTQYGYYPYLTGGTIGISMSFRDPNGVLSSGVGMAPVQVSPTMVNGISVPIATAIFPASSFPQGGNYYSQQVVSTVGNLQFKQKLNQPLVYTHNITPLYTSFSILLTNPTPAVVSPNAPSAGYGQSTTSIDNHPLSTSPLNNQRSVPIGSTPFSNSQQPVAPTVSPPSSPLCPSNSFPVAQGSNYACLQYFDYLATNSQSYEIPQQNTVTITIAINGWSKSSSVPLVQITSPDNPTFVTEFTLNHSPDSTNGNLGIWHKQLTISSDLRNLTGRFQVELMPFNIQSSDYTIPATYSDYQVLGNGLISCPAGSIATFAPSLAQCNLHEVNYVSQSNNQPTAASPTNPNNTPVNCPTGSILIPDANGGKCETETSLYAQGTGQTQMGSNQAAPNGLSSTWGGFLKFIFGQ